MTIKAKLAATLAVLVVILSAAGATYFRGSWSCRDGVWVMAGHPLSRQPQTVCAQPQPAPVVPPKKICDPPWSCGKLMQGETGMKPGVWYLKYDDVTGPARLEIVFTDGATCRVNDATSDCARVYPPNGSASSFSGYKDGEVFRVSSLDFWTKK